MGVSILNPIARNGARILNGNGDPVFTFDATLSEKHTHTAAISEHPVSEGADITDHIQIKTFDLALSGLITNTPIDAESQALEQVGDLRPYRLQEQHRQLVELFLLKAEFTIITGLERYERMAIKSIDTMRSSPVQSVAPKIILKQIRKAKSILVSVPASILAQRAKKSGSSKKDKDQQAKKDAKGEQLIVIKKDRSLLENGTRNGARIGVKAVEALDALGITGGS